MLTIDASVLVAAHAADEPAHDAARSFLARAFASGVVVHEPTLAVVEVTAGIARKTGDAAHARTVGTQVLRVPSVEIHSLDAELAVVAARVASDLRLKAGDAVYAAVAVRHGTTLVTLDAELAGRASAVVVTGTPADWLAKAGE